MIACARAFSLIVAVSCAFILAPALLSRCSTTALAQETVIPAPGPESMPAAKKTAPVDATTRAILAPYGTFSDHPIYGEVWRPTVVPADWRPYAACHWVNSRTLGWYYDDRTPWGAIIHHYGRWTHDAAMGWIWVHGAVFGPGWVAWRGSPSYVGWAPLPPDDNIKFDPTHEKADAFNNEAFWTFMETALFDKGCTGRAVLAPARTVSLFGETQPVTDVAFAGGIWVIVLPAYVVGPVVDVTVSFKPWPNGYLAFMLAKWTTIWNSWDVHTTVNYVDCARTRPPHLTERQLPPARRPPPSMRNCGAGYLQPDGSCARPQTFAALPVPAEPTVYLPLPVPPPVVIVPPPRPVIVPIGPRPCRPGRVRGPDGHCGPDHALQTALPPVVPLRPPMPPPVITARLPNVDPPQAGCGLLRGAAQRRCRDGEAASGSSKPTPARPIAQASTPRHPVTISPVLFRPTTTAKRPRPIVRRPGPSRPVFHRPSRPRPVFHPVTRRPMFHVSRPRPAFRAPPRARSQPQRARPVFRPAPRINRPSGGRRRR